jgi:hypothetical protein
LKNWNIKYNPNNMWTNTPIWTLHHNNLYDFNSRYIIRITLIKKEVLSFKEITCFILKVSLFSHQSVLLSHKVFFTFFTQLILFSLIFASLQNKAKLKASSTSLSKSNLFIDYCFCILFGDLQLHWGRITGFPLCINSETDVPPAREIYICLAARLPPNHCFFICITVLRTFSFTFDIDAPTRPNYRLKYFSFEKKWFPGAENFIEFWRTYGCIGEIEGENAYCMEILQVKHGNK